MYIKTNSSDYIIGKVFSCLTLNNFHLIAFFFEKMILTKTYYNTHNDNFLAIVKVFKT